NGPTSGRVLGITTYSKPPMHLEGSVSRNHNPLNRWGSWSAYELRDKYANDVEALAVLDQLAEEPEIHRRYSGFYAYEFFVARRPFTDTARDERSARQRA
ncbi:hypothetical protein ACNSTU_17145, partial [Aquisalimonas sp. APHAB1-3]